jgi:hypothetical protein
MHNVKAQSQQWVPTRYDGSMNSYHGRMNRTGGSTQEMIVPPPGLEKDVKEIAPEKTHNPVIQHAL